ncbi:MAG: M24 family metallopeptidase [Anaerolineae bacterium]
MRLDSLRTRITQHNLDGFLITDPVNRRYVTGFSGTAGWAFVTDDHALLAVDFRYFERAAREAPDWEQVRVKTRLEDTLVEMVARTGVKRLGYEGDHVTVSLYNKLAELVPEVELVPVDKMVLPLREFKDKAELASLRAAIACADEAFAHLCTVLRPGMSEREVAWELEQHMRQHGASATSFELIVGSGPNGAMPHATAGERVLRAGEPIVMDFGCVVDGYCSDITRTLSLGTGDERYDEIWHLVLEAQLAVETRVRPGMNGKEVDAIARDIFTAAGYGEHFGHGLGHGVGLAIHEDPYLGMLAEETILQPGMVFTVEPGLYFPGWGGVRIEDIVLLGEDGAEVLTQAPKEAVLPLQM